MQVLVEEEALRRLVREEAEQAVRAALAAQDGPSGYMTARGAAAYLGMTEGGLRRSSQRGEVPCVRLPSGRVRYERRALDEWVRSAP